MKIYDKIARNNYQECLAITSLAKEEFFYLLEVFSGLWENYYKHYDLKGNIRQKPKFKEDARISLCGTEEKLLFILTYLKENPTQQYQGLLFGMSQGKVSIWVKCLLPILVQSLKILGVAAHREPCDLYKTLLVLSKTVLWIEASERKIPRSQDYERQQYEYSGKKKQHMVKNHILCDENGYIWYLSPTYAGSIHDKVMAEESEYIFPEDTILLEDLGYLGFRPEGAEVLTSFKKPRNGELNKAQKQCNKVISSIRVKVEHVFSSVKRLRIIKDKIRLKNTEMRDVVMVIAVGLHNLRCKFRQNIHHN